MTIANLPYVSPEKDVVTMSVVTGNGSVEIRDWLSYSFNSHFLTPTDGWSFELAADMLTDEERAALVPGAEIQLSINDHQQCSGYIDQLQFSASRSIGAIWSISGRDKLSTAVDANADPRVQFNQEQSLYEVLSGIFAPFGWTGDNILMASESINIGVITGELRGVPTSPKKGKVLKGFETHRLRPHQNEGAFAFAARIAQRHGLWIWLSANGETLIIGRPCFQAPPDGPVPDLNERYLYTIVRSRDGRTNVLGGNVTLDLTEQPSAIIADAVGAANEFGSGQFRTIMVNPTIETPDQENLVREWSARGAHIIDGTFVGNKLKSSTPRPMYLHDSESKTHEQLDRFVQREMSLRMRRSMTAHYSFEGHVMNGAVWAVDTIAYVDDEVAGLKEFLYVLGRTFTKDRSGGTKTELELIRPFSIEF